MFCLFNNIFIERRREFIIFNILYLQIFFPKTRIFPAPLLCQLRITRLNQTNYQHTKWTPVQCYTSLPLRCHSPQRSLVHTDYIQVAVVHHSVVVTRSTRYHFSVLIYPLQILRCFRQCNQRNTRALRCVQICKITK